MIQEKGVAIYLAIVTMTVLLGIGVGLSTILIGQIKTTKGMGDSVVAFYAADTGIERELYESRKVDSEPKPIGTTYSGFLDINGNGTTPSGVCPDALETDPDDSDDACYKVDISAPSAPYVYIVKSIGFYKGVQRAIEISF